MDWSVDVRFSIIAWSRKRWRFLSHIMWIECYQTDAVPFVFSKFIPRRLQQRAKQGFCVPLDAWFEVPLRDMAYDSLLSPRADRGYFQTETLRSLLWEHQSGKWNHGDKLWLCSCFETWHQEYIDSQATPLSVREPSALVGQAS